MKSNVLPIVVAAFLFAGSCLGQCPTISVIGPPGVTQPGDKMMFRLEGASPDLKFSWTINSGKIIEGQGTRSITIATDKSMAGGNVTATVVVDGLPSACTSRASETAPLAVIFEWESIDEWGKLKPNDERGRIDAFLAELGNYPTNTGLMILGVTKGERFDSKNRRIQFILAHLRFRKFDPSRIWFSLRRAEDRRTTLYRFYPGSEDDIPCKGCLIVKGGDLK